MVPGLRHRHGFAVPINGAGCIATMQPPLFVLRLLFWVASGRANMQSKDDQIMRSNLCLFFRAA
jgi:hypothetical protein